MPEILRLVELGLGIINSSLPLPMYTLQDQNYFTLVEEREEGVILTRFMKSNYYNEKIVRFFPKQLIRFYG